jgi:hypothetical protein
MLKTISIFVFSVLSFQLSAQSAAVIDKMTESACECVSKKDISKIKSSDVEMELGLCIMGALEFIPKKELDKFDISDEKKMSKLGEDIGVRMAVKCPKTLMAIALVGEKRKNKDNDSDDAPPPPPPPADWGKMEGKVKEVIEGEFVTIVLSDKNQREQRFLWIAHFNGESDYIANPQLLKGKELEITFYTQDRYVVKMHDYVTFKQITELKEK